MHWATANYRSIPTTNASASTRGRPGVGLPSAPYIQVLGKYLARLSAFSRCAIPTAPSAPHIQVLGKYLASVHLFAMRNTDSPPFYIKKRYCCLPTPANSREAKHKRQSTKPECELPAWQTTNARIPMALGLACGLWAVEFRCAYQPNPTIGSGVGSARRAWRFGVETDR